MQLNFSRYAWCFCLFDKNPIENNYYKFSKTQRRYMHWQIVHIIQLKCFRKHYYKLKRCSNKEWQKLSLYYVFMGCFWSNREETIWRDVKRFDKWRPGWPLCTLVTGIELNISQKVIHIWIHTQNTTKNNVQNCVVFYLIYLIIISDTKTCYCCQKT